MVPYFCFLRATNKVNGFPVNAFKIPKNTSALITGIVLIQLSPKSNGIMGCAEK